MSLKPNFLDERGTIRDLMVTPDYSVTHITFTKGAVRGNHYHKKTTQKDIVILGKLLCSQDGHTFTLDKGDGVIHPPETKHAFKALEYSEIISICFGVRRGSDYEKDTFRLDKKLL